MGREINNNPESNLNGANNSRNNSLNREVYGMTPNLSAHADNIMLANAKAEGFDASPLQDPNLANQFNALFINLNMAESVNKGLGMKEAYQYYVQAIKIADGLDENAIAKYKSNIEAQIQKDPNSPQALALAKEDMDLTYLQQAPSFTRANLGLAMLKLGHTGKSTTLLMEASQMNPQMLNDVNFQREYQQALNSDGQKVPQGYPYFANGNDGAQTPTAGLDRGNNGQAGSAGLDRGNNGNGGDRQTGSPGSTGGSGTANALSPLEQAQQALSEVQQSGKLTPAINQEFLKAIQESTSGSSPILPELLNQENVLKGKLHAQITPAMASALGQIDAQVQMVASKYPQNVQVELADLYKNLAQAPSLNAQNTVESEMVKIAPALQPILANRNKITEPLDSNLFELNKTRLQISEEKNAPALTCFEYANALMQSGDKAQAQKYFLTAIQKNIDPALAQTLRQDAINAGVPANEIQNTPSQAPGADTPPAAPQAPGADTPPAGAATPPQAGADTPPGAPQAPGADTPPAGAATPPQAGADTGATASSILDQADAGFNKATDKQTAIKQYAPEYEKAIALADSEFNTINQQVTADDAKLEQKAQPYLTPAYKNELNTLKTAVDNDIKALTPAEQQEYNVLNDPKATAAQKAAARAGLEKSNPQLFKDMQAYADKLNPLLAITAEVKKNDTAKGEAELAKFYARLEYAKALDEASQDNLAKNELLQAFSVVDPKIWPALEKSPEVSALASKLKISEADITAYAKAHPVTDTGNGGTTAHQPGAPIAPGTDTASAGTVHQPGAPQSPGTDAGSGSVDPKEIQKNVNEGLAALKKSGIIASEPFFEKAIAESQKLNDPVALTKQIDEIEGILKSGQLNGKPLTSAEILTAHTMLKADFTSVMQPIQLMEGYAAALAQDKQYKKAASVYQEAINLSDKLPIVQMKEEVSLLNDAIKNPDFIQDQAGLKKFQTELQGTDLNSGDINAPITLRKILVQFYLGSLINAKTGKNDLADVFQPQQAMDLINQAKALEKSTYGIDLDKDPSKDPLLSQLATLTIDNMPAELKKKYENLSGFWNHAIADTSAGIVGMGLAIGVAALLRNPEIAEEAVAGGADIGKTGLMLGKGALSVGAGLAGAIGTDYEVFNHISGSKESVADAALHGSAALAGMGAIYFGKDTFGKLLFKGPNTDAAALLERVGNSGVDNLGDLNKILDGQKISAIAIKGVDNSASTLDIANIARGGAMTGAKTAGELTDHLGVLKSATSGVDASASIGSLAGVDSKLAASLANKGITTAGDAQKVLDQFGSLADGNLAGISADTKIADIGKALPQSAAARATMLKDTLDAMPKSAATTVSGSENLAEKSITDFNKLQGLRSAQEIKAIAGIDASKVTVGQLSEIDALNATIGEPGYTTGQLLGRVKQLDTIATSPEFADEATAKAALLKNIPNFPLDVAKNLASKYDIYTVEDLQKSSNFQEFEQKITSGISPSTKISDINTALNATTKESVAGMFSKIKAMPGKIINAGLHPLDTAKSIGNLAHNINPFSTMDFETTSADALKYRRFLSGYGTALTSLSAYAYPTGIYDNVFKGEINPATGKPYTLGQEFLNITWSGRNSGSLSGELMGNIFFQAAMIAPFLESGAIAKNITSDVGTPSLKNTLKSAITHPVDALKSGISHLNVAGEAGTPLSAFIAPTYWSALTHGFQIQQGSNVSAAAAPYQELLDQSQTPIKNETPPAPSSAATDTSGNSGGANTTGNNSGS